MNFISSYMYICVYQIFFYLEVLLFYGGGCDGVGECSVKGALCVTRGEVCEGRGRWRKVCIGSAMQKGVGEDGKGSRIAL